jgi:ankyrin repeat protein
MNETDETSAVNVKTSPDLAGQSGDENGDRWILEMLDMASQRLAAKDYITAGAMLQQVMAKSEDKYGSSFLWRDETIEKQVTVCWELGKWEEAEKILDQQFKGRAKLMHSLATKSVANGKRNSAERLLSKHFDGREAIMEILAESYVRDKQWKKAKRLLIELLDNETNQPARLERMHALANVCFSLKEYGEAEAWCLKVLIGRQGELCPKFYESVRLLARIYNADDAVQASAYETVLADLSLGLHGTSPITFLTIECVEIEQLSCLLEDSRACRDATEQIGRKFFKNLLSNYSERQPVQSIRDNIKHRSKITGCGRGWSLLHELAAHDLELAVQLLLEKGADIEANCESGTPLIVAAEKGNPNTVRLLLKRGCQIEAKNKQGCTALIMAVTKGSHECVRELLNHGANIEATDKGQTPLILAAIHGHEEIVQILLERRVNIEAKSKMGTALIEATWGRSTGIVKLLLEKGAKTETISEKHGTALNIAAGCGYKEICQLLLDHGANIESRNKEGKTPLISAAKNERTEVVRLLLAREANVKAKDIYGQTALSLANRAPALKGTTLSQMTELHITETVTLLLSEMRRGQQGSRTSVSSLDQRRGSL